MELDQQRATVEIVYTWPDGRQEVRYRRLQGTAGADELVRQVQALQASAQRGGYVSPYSYRTR